MLNPLLLFGWEAAKMQNGVGGGCVYIQVDTVGFSTLYLSLTVSSFPQLLRRILF